MDERTAERTLEHIKEIALQARTTWFTLLFLLAFAGITLLGVEHADFYAYGRQTQLPLVGVSIPTTSFFAAAPALITALYVYLHLQLIQLWQALDRAHVPAELLGQPLGRVVHPGLITDFALRMRSDGSADSHALAWLSRLVVLLLVWLFAPLVVAGFWWQSMSARNEVLTFALWMLLIVAALVAFASLWRVGKLAPVRWRWRCGQMLGAIMLLLTLPTAGVLSYVRTEGGTGWAVASLNSVASLAWSAARFDDIKVRYPALDERLWPLFALAPVDLRGEVLVNRPIDWLDRDAARDAFFNAWCARKQNNACEWDEERQSAVFASAWRIRRAATLANLPKLERRGADLREADLARAFLPGVDLRRAQLERAVLSRARLEGANLSEARLEGADLRGARLDDAVLRRAWLRGARLSLALASADELDLWEAPLERADFSPARLEGADLFGARLVGADLQGVWLQGADLRGAQLQGTDLRGAELKGAKLNHARLAGSVLSFADFTATVLYQSQLDDAIGDMNTILPRDGETGAQLYVWSCWEEEPPTLETTLALFREEHHDELRAEWLCNGRLREKVGRPAPETEAGAAG